MLADRYVIGREHNVVLVDFRPQPEPPAPRFPGAGALQIEDGCRQGVEAEFFLVMDKSHWCQRMRSG